MPENETKSSVVGKWIAGIAGMVAMVVLIWWLTNLAVGVPHAPPIVNTFGVPLFDEHQQLISIRSGEQVHLKVMDIWSAPQGATPSCADGFMALTWIVRDPYPTGGEDLQIHSLIPRGGGRTEIIALGAKGSVTLSYCDEIFLFNTSLQEYVVEIRYTSGIY